MIKLWHETAWADYEYWQSQDKKTLRRINTLLKDIERNAYNGMANRSRSKVIYPGGGVFV